MSDLGVAEYDSAEQKAISVMPNSIIESVQSIVFQDIGYPARVGHEAELFKYVEVMHPFEFEDHFSNLLGGITKGEFELLTDLTTEVSQFTQYSYGRKYLARASLLGGLNVFRHIRYLFGEARPAVFEIGPGNGYLGALLIRSGYPYGATDVSQAFYLYQSHLWNFISGGNLTEMAHGTKGENGSGFSLAASGGATHLPWWEFVRLRPDAVPEIDVVTCNRALCEMHSSSLGFALNIAHAFMDNQRRPTAFVFYEWGASNKNSMADVAKCFYEHGFVMVHNDARITVFAPQGSDSAIGHVSLPWRRQPIRTGIRNVLRRVLDMPSIDTLTYAPPHFASQRNPLSRAISSGRVADRDAKTITIDQLNQFYTEQLGHENHLSPDEEFTRLTESG
ncbi:hypothetical protein M1N45_01780 [Dehalococcoidia bacterium]|nr:hypothetical protein [Dehalococcoidia bacterium]